VIAIDCWSDYPDAMVEALLEIPAELTLCQSHEREPHPGLAGWPRNWSVEQLRAWAEDRPFRVIYAGQAWNLCVQTRPLGIRELRSWPLARVQVRSDLIRVQQQGLRACVPALDLEPQGWHRVTQDLWQI
jgi:hypothetical protein